MERSGHRLIGPAHEVGLLELIEWVWALTGWALEIVKRPRDSHHFQVRTNIRVAQQVPS